MITFWSQLIHLLASVTLVVCHNFDERWNLWWGYDAISGPSMWGEMVPEFSLCSTGKQQSPIDIRPADLLFDPNLKHVKVESLPVNGQLINTGNDITFLLDNEFTTTVNVSEGPLSYVYHVTSIKFHFSKSDLGGSEHHVAGQAFPAEMHIIGYNGNLYNNMSRAENSSNGIVVLSSFLKINPYQENFPNSALNMITSSLQSIKGTGSSVQIQFFGIPELLPKTDHYMTYEGSMTQPSCQETVTWIVFNKATYISEEQLAAFKKVPMEWTESNSRPVMPLNHRVVRTNIDTKTPVLISEDVKILSSTKPNDQIPKPGCFISTRRSKQTDAKQPLV